MSEEPQIDRILFATDFLSSSHLALDYAIAFAQHFKAKIVMIHAIELSYPAAAAETETLKASTTRRLALARLKSLASRAEYSGLQTEAYVEDGIPSEVVLRAIDVHSADLLILGVHGVHRGLDHLLIGSNTEKILLAASCPTMTVGAHVMDGLDPVLHFNKILYFSDLSPEAAAAAPYATFLSREFHAPIDVCQLLPQDAEATPQTRHNAVEEYCEAMLRLYPDAKPAWCTPSFQLEHGRGMDEVIERAQSQQAGLIVLGTHAESHLGRRLHTSFAYQLLAKASCPVISIRSPASNGS